MMPKFILPLLQTLPIMPVDSLSNRRQEIEMLKTLPADELIQRVISALVTFSINLTLAILVFYAGKFIINKIHALLLKIFVKRKMDKSLSTFILSLIRMVLYFLLIVTVIGILGIETSSFIALFASAGVALGMALSGTLQNFAGGVLILLLKPYKVGDYVEVQGYAGTIKEIQIFNTIITTPDNKSIIIPNGGLSTGSINNYSREKYRRIDWTIAISYGDNVDDARQAILDILASDQRIVKQYIEDEEATKDDKLDITRLTPKVDRSPVVYLSQLADSSVNLSIRAWARNTDYWAVYFSMNEKFYNELPKHGVNFPFPQMDVHVKE